jgi:hypothetical protein
MSPHMCYPCLRSEHPRTPEIYRIGPPAVDGFLGEAESCGAELGQGGI